MGAYEDYKQIIARNRALVTEAGARSGMYGGGLEESQARDAALQAGSDAGAAQANQGVSILGGQALMGSNLAASGRDATDVGMGAFGAGLNMAGQARGDQAGAIDLQRAAAMGQAPSQAQMLMRGAGDQQAQQMMAQAQAARGGNAAAAMRGAQYQAASNNAQIAQQMGALRAQEMAQARGAYGDMATGIRGQDLGTAQLGGQMAGIGYSAQTAGMQGVGAAGANMGNIGAGREASYLGAQNAKAQFEAAARVAAQNSVDAQVNGKKAQDAAMAGQLLGTGGAIVGGIYGGPAGAAAGGTAGQVAGKKVVAG